MKEPRPPAILFPLRVRPWYRRWPRHYRWARSLGYGRIRAAWIAATIGHEWLRLYRVGPPR